MTLSNGPISPLDLAIAVSRTNSRYRLNGLSAHEALFQRDQYTSEQLPIRGQQRIAPKHQSRLRNHPYSERSKAPTQTPRPNAQASPGDLVFLYNDLEKHRRRSRYIVVD